MTPKRPGRDPQSTEPSQVPAEATPAPRRSVGGLLAVGVVFAIALVAALWWGVRSARRPGSAPPASSAPPAVADSIAALDPAQAYVRALALGQTHHFDQSLPYFRRALEIPPEAWEPYCDYAIALFQATLQARQHLGWTQSVTRSSFERVAMLHEAARSLDRAESLAKTPADRAYIIAHRARMLSAWGLSWNAVSEFFRGGALDPALVQQARAVADRMRDPVLERREEIPR